MSSPLSPFGLDSAIPAVGTGRTFWAGEGPQANSLNPDTEEPIVTFADASRAQTDKIIAAAQAGFAAWRTVPAPKRAEVLLTFADALRRHREDLARLMTLETAKPLRESRAEVDDAIATAIYAAGLGRTVGGGQQFPSLRPGIELHEKWHPLGPVLIITAFNFPLSLWAWNVCLAVVCGNSTVWKGAPQTPLMTVGAMKVVAEVLAKHPDVPEGVFCFINGTVADVAAPLVASPAFPLVSATGSTAMGKKVGETVARRLGQCILELGGNAAGILTPSAPYEQALRTAFFAATNNGGQRCTALRRLLVHESLFDRTLARLKTAYQSWPAGDVFSDTHRQPPLIDAAARDMFATAITGVKKHPGLAELFAATKPLPNRGYYVTPHLAVLKADAPQPQEETFGPLLYVQPYRTFDEAVAKANGVPQGLGSGVFTRDLAEMQAFISVTGSDAGVASVNDNTGGIEVALAFGGNKESGFGREKGSDSWKQYMRRLSVVLNPTDTVPDAAGINFGA